MLGEVKALIAAAIVALVLIVGLGVTAAVYKNLYDTTKAALDTVNGSVKLQNEEAERQFTMLKADRDRKQALIDQAAKELEAKDAAAKNEITRLDSELRNRPVLVRIVAGKAGESGSSSAGNHGTNTENSSGGGPAAYGLLPPENTRRLNEALTEVELLSAAYTSCRARLIQTRSN